MFSIIEKKFNTFKFTNNVIKGLFYLLLGISSNFIGDTMGCQVQQLFNKSVIFKQLIVYFTIFFGIDISDGKNLKLNDKLKITTIVYILFTILANMNIKFSILAFGLITILYLLNTYISELKPGRNDNIKANKKYNQIREIRKKVSILLVFVICIGVYYYYRLKKEEFGDNFNIISFLFEQNNCKFNEKLDLNINFLTGE